MTTSSKLDYDTDGTQTFMAEWSAPQGCELDDIEAIQQANPGLGYLFGLDSIKSDLENDPAEVYRTEVLCQRVEHLDGAFDLEAWKSGKDASGTLAHQRDRITMGLDVSLDGLHITAAVCAELSDGRYRVEPAGAWTSTQEARQALPGLIGRLRPITITWFRNGPASPLGADLRALADDETVVDAIAGAELMETCMEFVDLVGGGRILHGNDPLFNAQVTNAGKRKIGDGFVIVRSGKAHVDAVYAMAGAVHGARNMPVEEVQAEPMLIAAW
jgi:phage terminase large subunit-like protein